MNLPGPMNLSGPLNLSGPMNLPGPLRRPACPQNQTAEPDRNSQTATPEPSRLPPAETGPPRSRTHRTPCLFRISRPRRAVNREMWRRGGRTVSSPPAVAALHTLSRPPAAPGLAALPAPGREL